jgi:hypothetical protein
MVRNTGRDGEEGVDFLGAGSGLAQPVGRHGAALLQEAEALVHRTFIRFGAECSLELRP